jgi:hypothetical protein
MKRILIITAIVIACLGGLYIYLTWGKAPTKGNEKATVELTKAQELLVETNNPIESEQISSDSTTDQKTLNDIRFGNWTDNDWYDNDYFRFLRQTFNDCLAGKIEMEELAPYKSLLSSKFVIGEASPFILGGLLVDLIFIDAPDKVFSVHIYSDVNEASETVTGYKIVGFMLNDGDSGFTKEMILELVKEHPENQLW